jgi:hypothetical protein
LHGAAPTRRAAAAESPHSPPSFRALCEAEAEAIVGAELFAQVAAGTGVVVEISLPH